VQKIIAVTINSNNCCTVTEVVFGFGLTDFPNFFRCNQEVLGSLRERIIYDTLSKGIQDIGKEWKARHFRVVPFTRIAVNIERRIAWGLGK